MSDLKKQTLKGIAFLGAGKSLGRVLSFINTLILARLLLPEDYGLMAMAMVVIGFVGFFNDVGLGSAIIQRKEITQNQLSNVFYFSLVISILLCGLMYLASPSVADFYQNQEITPILQVIAITFVLGALKTVPEALMVKEMKFKYLSGIEFLTIVFQCAVTLAFAYLDYKTWSLVYGLLAASTLRLLLTNFLAKWTPSLHFNFKESVSLLTFGATVTYSRVTWFLYTNSQTLILGKLAGDKKTGVFSMAQTFADLPTAHITNLVIQVASPLFSKLQEDFNALNHSLIRLTAGLSLLTFPVLIGMVMTANEMIPVVLGDNWNEVAPVMQLLCVMALIKSIDPLLTQAFISIGKAKLTAYYTSICAVVIPCSIIVGTLNNGVIGAAASMAIVYPFLLFILLFLANKYFQLPLMSYLAAITTPITGCIFMAACIYGMSEFTPLSNLDLVSLLISKVIVGVISYAFWIIYIRPDGIQLLYSVLVDIGVPSYKLARWPFKSVKR